MPSLSRWGLGAGDLVLLLLLLLDVLRLPAPQLGWPCWNACSSAASCQQSPPCLPWRVLPCAQATGCSDAKAEEMIKKLSDSGRYHKDVW